MFSRLVFGLSLLSATALVHPAFATDARALQIFVSKSKQSLTVYDGADVIVTSKISSGKSGHTTPSGIFSVIEKQTYHESNIYSGAPMPFMQRLTWSGIALHQSNSVPRYPASHGCVRMPDAFAKQLYKMTEMGVPVIITDAQLAPEPVDHPTLFSPHAPPPAPLLSDVELRPAIGSLPVQVAMNEVAMPRLQVQPIVAPVNDQPVKILITRRAQRETIIDLQTYLAELGFAVGNADGYLGPATVQAIGEFKKQHPMNPDAAKSLISDDLLRAVYSAAGKGEPPNGVIMVRQGFQQVFEAPVTIAQPELALGTHFFSAHEVNFEDGTTEWLGVTLPNTLTSQTMKRLGISTMESSIISGTPILNALGRITIPDDTRQRIDSMLTSGSTLTISDTGVGPETGQGTDFITLTRG
ncbi:MULTISPECIES: L,D-transpeptidase family protein [unclassified Rhizobium]|uniref:L,D-transpeptidase family protein n=1 Tax=unclassified Rhizobium TaxID=2613769 RepID=UPI001AD98BC9|nr:MULTISPECIES: L,D-transpeptidase family protein [unclassified Rhizobium]MBO9123574.1 L,D-transpeptidase family protein [Rhizobium sp. 16-488-2b]MBO9174106.1 L,D-transpeptidase family protein [Rhizobium sp. 16-488-2a]